MGRVAERCVTYGTWAWRVVGIPLHEPGARHLRVLGVPQEMESATTTNTEQLMRFLPARLLMKKAK